MFPKESHEWIKWIQDGKAIRIDQKEKVQDLINSLRTNPAESERIGLNLDPATKIVQNFENPKLPSENNTRFSVSYSSETDNTLTETARQEMTAITEQAKANGTYMQAPNGKPNRLSERQWLQVRTQAFKKWFGDWKLAAKAKAIQALQVIHFNRYSRAKPKTDKQPNGSTRMCLSKRLRVRTESVCTTLPLLPSAKMEKRSLCPTKKKKEAAYSGF